MVELKGRPETDKTDTKETKAADQRMTDEWGKNTRPGYGKQMRGIETNWWDI